MSSNLNKTIGSVGMKGMCLIANKPYSNTKNKEVAKGRARGEDTGDRAGAHRGGDRGGAHKNRRPKGEGEGERDGGGGAPQTTGLRVGDVVAALVDGLCLLLCLLYVCVCLRVYLCACSSYTLAHLHTHTHVAHARLEHARQQENPHSLKTLTHT